MAIVNRDLDLSEQRVTFQGKTVGVLANSGGSLTQAEAMFIVPFPCTLDAARISSIGSSGTVVAGLQTARFITGAGLTMIPLVTATMTISVFGTSGGVGFSLPAAGSTLLALQTNDVLILHNFGGSGAALNAGAQMAVVLRAVADIKQPLGLTS